MLLRREGSCADVVGVPPQCLADLEPFGQTMLSKPRPPTHAKRWHLIPHAGIDGQRLSAKAPHQPEAAPSAHRSDTGSLGPRIRLEAELRQRVGEELYAALDCRLGQVSVSHHQAGRAISGVAV